MNSKTASCLIKILINSVIAGACIYGSQTCYAQKQSIAESFGLYSKGIEYYHAGRLEEAKHAMEKSLLMDPGNEEAKGCLDMVNAEIKMRQMGKLDSYESEADFKRESNFFDREISLNE